MRGAVAHDMTRRYGEGDWSAAPGEALVLKQIRASRVLVARHGDEIVGTVRLTTAQQGLIDASVFTTVPTAIYVLGLAVAPHVRGQGIGRLLLEAAKAAVPDWPAEALWLDAYSDAAGVGDFYRRCGFRPVSRTNFNGMPLIYFEWLSPDSGTAPRADAL